MNIEVEKDIIEIKTRREEQFPTDPHERFSAIFPSIGNSEAKCVMLLCLTEFPQTGYGLHRKFMQESSDAWRHDEKLQENYCNSNFIPIGLVAAADTLYDSASEYITGYRLTSAGRRYGQPIAAYLLEQSSQLPFSLLQIFGQTSTGPGKTRPVLNKVSILKYLYEETSQFRATDIALAVGLQAALVGKRLRDLAKVGLVDYSSTTVEKPGFAKYTLVEDADREQVTHPGTSVKLTAIVADLLFELKTIDAHSLAALLQERYSEPYKKMSFKNLRHRISTILAHLSRNNICHTDSWQGRKIQSSAQISGLGRTVVERIIDPVEEALAEDESLLISWKGIPWQELAPAAVAKYSQSSGNANRRASREWMDDALNIIVQNPGIRPREVRAFLGHNPSNPLKELLASGKIRKERKGYSTLYFHNIQASSG